MNKKDDRFEEEIVAELKADFKKRREERENYYHYKINDYRCDNFICN